MTRLPFVCLLATLAAVVSLSSPARAQITNQKYASPAGAGGTCSAGTPCSLFTAITSAPSGGEVSCIDGGFFFSSFSTGGSLTIDCPGAVLTALMAPALTLSGTNLQVVILRNLTFDGGGQFGTPFIVVNGGATLIIENCKFENIANGNAIAIQFLPNSPAAQLIIRDSVFANNGIAPSSGGGLQVAPAAGGSASVVLERVSFNLNVTSMVLSGPVNATMVNSTVSASRSTGIIVGSGATLDVKGSTLVYNVGSAISVAGGGTVRLSDNDIKSNQIGISNSGGQALTYSNNRILGNGSTAALTPIQGNQ
jgi:Right handed beta helix region